MVDGVLPVLGVCAKVETAKAAAIKLAMIFFISIPSRDHDPRTILGLSEKRAVSAIG